MRLVGERVHAYDRAKDLFLLHSCIVCKASDDGRVDKVAVLALTSYCGSVSSENDRAALLASKVDIVQHLVHVLLANQRSDSGFRVKRVADLIRYNDRVRRATLTTTTATTSSPTYNKLLCFLNKALHELIVHRLMHKDARVAQADLTLVRKGRLH
jgi:hypothetical protein